MPLPDTAKDRLFSALIATDATSADGTPALRVQYVAAAAAAGTTRAIPDDLMDRLKGSFVLTDAANAEGSPAMRAQAV